LIEQEDVVITVSHLGYIKRTSASEYRAQRRGGRGAMGGKTRDEDYIEQLFVASTHDNLLLFTDLGRCYWLKVYELPEGEKVGKGRAIQNLLQLPSDDKIRAIINVHNLADEEYVNNNYIVLCTKKGIIKKTSLDSFNNPRQAGIIALTTDLEDRVVDCKISDGQSDIFVATREGMSIRFNENDVRAMGRSARGVKGITLADKDSVVAMEILEKNTTDTILMVTTKGYGKRSETGEYRIQSRGGSGIITQKTTDKVGRVVGTKKVSAVQELILSTDQGQVIRMKISDISVLGRNTQGVRLINLDDKQEFVTGLAVILDEDRVGEETH